MIIEDLKVKYDKEQSKQLSLDKMFQPIFEITMDELNNLKYYS